MSLSPTPRPAIPREHTHVPPCSTDVAVGRRLCMRACDFKRRLHEEWELVLSDQTTLAPPDTILGGREPYEAVCSPPMPEPCTSRPCPTAKREANEILETQMCNLHKLKKTGKNQNSLMRKFFQASRAARGRADAGGSHYSCNFSPVR